MSVGTIKRAIKKGRYLSFVYRKPGKRKLALRYVSPQEIKNDLLVAFEYTPANQYEGTRKNFKLDLIGQLTVMPDQWSPAFEWRERTRVTGDVVIEDRTTLKDRRKGRVANVFIRKRRRGLLRLLFGD